MSDFPIIELSKVPNKHSIRGRSQLVVYLWGICEIILVSNPFQISSSLRVLALRTFGAKIGTNVIFRPRTRVKFPWKLSIGDSSWIGEGVWFHNQDQINIGSNVVISQESFLTTGSHSHRTDMSLITKPITIESGAWVTSRCVILGGTHVGKNSIVSPNSVVQMHIPEGEIWGGNPCVFKSKRTSDKKA